MIKLSDQICWLSSHRDDFISTPRSWSVLLHIIRWTYCISDQIKKSAQPIIQALVISRIHHSNFFLYWVSFHIGYFLYRKFSMLVLNCLTMSWSSQVWTLLLRSHRWLPVGARIKLKTLVFAYQASKTLHTGKPAQVSNLRGPDMSFSRV